MVPLFSYVDRNSRTRRSLGRLGAKHRAISEQHHHRYMYIPELPRYHRRVGPTFLQLLDSDNIKSHSTKSNQVKGSTGKEAVIFDLFKGTGKVHLSSKGK
jgi:hypothetical protein